MSQIDQRQMLPMGTVLDRRYRVVRYLASGGFGNTYVAEDTRLGDLVAVKEFFMRGTNHRSADGTTVEVSNEANISVFNTQLMKFRREGQRIFKLRNDHIIHVFDIFDANDTSYYVMNLIQGMSLADQVRQSPLKEIEVRDIALQVLDALEAMHQAGIYHLDIKPANIMRDQSGHCTVIDFGASKQLTADERSTLSSSVMSYTPGYAPLEQVAQHTKNIGPWTDFYAFGATLYRLLTGDPPPEVAVDDFAPNGRQFPYPPRISLSMRHAISTLMNPIHSLRPQNVAEVRKLFERNVQREDTIITSSIPNPVSPASPYFFPKASDSPHYNESTSVTSDTDDAFEESFSFTPDSDDAFDESDSSRKKLWIIIAVLAIIALILGIVLIPRVSDKKSNGLCPDGDHPHMIDLGLPSGTEWACCNVGAEKPEGIGDFYAWGEIKEKDEYDWNNYEYCNGTSRSCHDLGSNICGTKYDVAYVKWGNEWQMPTDEQFQELIDYCDSEWTTVNGVKGRRFTSKKNGKSIFLPADGDCSGSEPYTRGKNGNYWSGTPKSNTNSAYYFDFGSNYLSVGCWYRNNGHTIRPVAR